MSRDGRTIRTSPYFPGRERKKTVPAFLSRSAVWGFRFFFLLLSCGEFLVGESRPDAVPSSAETGSASLNMPSIIGLVLLVRHPFRRGWRPAVAPPATDAPRRKPAVVHKQGKPLPGHLHRGNPRKLDGRWARHGPVVPQAPSVFRDNFSSVVKKCASLIYAVEGRTQKRVSVKSGESFNI